MPWLWYTSCLRLSQACHSGKCVIFKNNICDNLVHVLVTFGFRVRADTAVRPYAEDLSIRANSAVVQWQFEYRVRLCRGRLPRLPAGTNLRNAKRAGTEACPYEWLWEN